MTIRPIDVFSRTNELREVTGAGGITKGAAVPSGPAAGCIGLVDPPWLDWLAGADSVDLLPHCGAA
jgi:hypothetical protein